MIIENCEFCGERPGETNSRYWELNDDRIGGWVCTPCEQEFEQEHEDDMQNGYFADMSNVRGRLPEP